jgi:hypothetical protein
MSKILDKIRGLLPRRGPKPDASAEHSPVPAPTPADAADAGPSSGSEVDPAPSVEHPPVAETAPVPAHADPVADPVPAPDMPPAESLPVPVGRTGPDLILTLSGRPGMAGVRLGVLHVDIEQRGSDRWAEAFYPSDAVDGTYLLDVTGHALTFGPPGRMDANVLVPVRTRADTASSLPRNAAGNALVPIDSRIIDRIDRETGVAKTRLRRVPVVGLAFMEGLVEAPPKDDPALDEIPVELDAPDGDAPGPTAEETRARQELDMMGYLLAQQTFTPPEEARADEAEGKVEDAAEDAEGRVSEREWNAPGEPVPQGGDASAQKVDPGTEWTPSTAYGR